MWSFIDHTLYNHHRFRWSKLFKNWTSSNIGRSLNSVKNEENSRLPKNFFYFRSSPSGWLFKQGFISLTSRICSELVESKEGISLTPKYFNWIFWSVNGLSWLTHTFYIFSLRCRFAKMSEILSRLKRLRPDNQRVRLIGSRFESWISNLCLWK